MNPMKFLSLLLFTLILLGGCQKDNFNPKNPDVELFVYQLKNGTYNCYEKGEKGENLWLIMPEFKEKHIPELLELAKDTSHILNFPVNPMSSRTPVPYGRNYFILGECLLWIVEGIRNDKTFPSLDPYMVRISPEFNASGLSGAEILSVWQLYHNWWNTNKKGNWQKINPLEGNSYKWM
jgi:hypothetical protein